MGALDRFIPDRLAPVALLGLELDTIAAVVILASPASPSGSSTAAGGRTPHQFPRMTPPRWFDDDGRESPTLPCPQCGRVIPIHRWQESVMRVHGRHAYGVASWVTWCGHLQEAVLVPQGDGTFGEVPVLGEAS
jgi:hypothetical protein